MNLNKRFLSVLIATTTLASAALKADDKAAAVPPAIPPAAPPKTGGSNADNLFPDPVVAKGTGFEIKRSRLDEAVSGIRASARASGRELMPGDLPIIERGAFDHLLQIELLKQAANESDKAQGRKLGDERFTRIRTNAPSDEALVKELKPMNLTLEQLHNRLIEEATAEEVLRDKVKVTDEQVKKFYDDNPSKFEMPERVRAAHILISTMDKTGTPMSEEDKKAKRKLAEEVLKKAKAGEDFGGLVKEYSDDPGSKNKGGEYTFPRGQMVPEFESAAFSMQTNQISDLVVTKYGFHIIKTLEKLPAKKVDFAEVKPRIREYLESTAMKDVLPTTIAQLKKDEHVVILDDELKALEEASPESKGGGPIIPLPK